MKKKAHLSEHGKVTINWTAASDDVNLALGQSAEVSASKAQANGDRVYNKISDSGDEHFRIQLNRRGRAIEKADQTVEIKNSESQTVELKIIKKDKESKLRIVLQLLDGESSESNVEKKPKNTSRNNSFSTPSILPARTLSPISEDRELRSFPG